MRIHLKPHHRDYIADRLNAVHIEMNRDREQVTDFSQVNAWFICEKLQEAMALIIQINNRRQREGRED